MLLLLALLSFALLGFDRLGQGSTRFVAAHPVLRALSSCYTTWISQFLSSLFLATLFLPSYFYRLIFTVFSAVLWCVFDQGCNDDHRPQPLTHPTRSSKGPPLKQIILVMYTVCIKKQLLARHDWAPHQAEKRQGKRARSLLQRSSGIGAQCGPMMPRLKVLP